MSESSSDAEKKHAPTPAKIRRAREQGQIKRSADFPKAAGMMFFILAITAAGGLLSRYVDIWFALIFAAAGRADLHDVRNLFFLFAALMVAFLLFAFIAIMGFASAAGGWMLNLVLLTPKIERLNPSSGVGQIFSMANLVEIAKSALKIAAIGGAGLLAFLELRPGFEALAAPSSVSLLSLGKPAFIVIAAATFAASVIAVADVGIQAWLQRRGLMMTDQEIRDEMKNNEGNPHVRARRRAMLRKMARGRQIAAVRQASVVVTNPTHFAVAIRFRKGVDSVPYVVAKGPNMNALRIITEAREHGIPVVEAPPVARALHRYVEVDEPIPSMMYKACAQILAYVWHLDLARRGLRPQPKPPQFADDREFQIRN